MCVSAYNTWLTPQTLANHRYCIGTNIQETKGRIKIRVSTGRFGVPYAIFKQRERLHTTSTPAKRREVCLCENAHSFSRSCFSLYLLISYFETCILFLHHLYLKKIGRHVYTVIRIVSFQMANRETIAIKFPYIFLFVRSLSSWTVAQACVFTDGWQYYGVYCCCSGLSISTGLKSPDVAIPASRWEGMHADSALRRQTCLALSILNRFGFILMLAISGNNW